ncbi:hypothetical protein GCM10008959_03740 [Deinococcus seoulensis]|uniref:Uncharacterized protein n=1 Tax=Deinococcus seoulensis TaxID=1837379 RepID=A0ABQ2RP24_9DEIO|nr:hypothetical protein GCM10008959_03740 [Deinococcus seoulensis]
MRDEIHDHVTGNVQDGLGVPGDARPAAQVKDFPFHAPPYQLPEMVLPAVQLERLPLSPLPLWEREGGAERRKGEGAR